MLSLTSLVLGIALSLLFWTSNIFFQNSSINPQVKSAGVINLPETKLQNNSISTPTPTSIQSKSIALPTPTVTQTPPKLWSSPTITPTPQPQGMAGKTLSLINKERQSRSLPPLRTSSTLQASAQKKAQDLLNKNYWSHTSPSGQEFWSFIEASGYNYLTAGENLAKGYFDAQSLNSGWMESESHRNNILNPTYQEVGISIIDGFFEGYQTKLVVAHFAQPS